jgi:hypothetical protein
LNSVIASLLPFDPIRLSNAAEESTQNNSTKTSSLEKLSHVESFGSAEQQLGELTSQPSLLVTSIEKNPAMAFTPYSLALLTNNPELTESILGQINLATVNNRTTRTWLLADYCLLAGEFEKAKELYQSSPEYSWFKQLNFTNQKDLLTSLTSILEELVQQSTIDKKPEQHLYYHSLLTYLRGGTLEFLPPPNKQDIRDHCNHLWIHFLFAHQEKTKLLVVRVNQLAAERYPAPFHFTHMAQLVKNTRIRNRQHTPATPVWMDDNFIFEPIRTDSLPLLAYLARNGIQSGGELGRHWAHLYSSIPEIRGQH